MMKQSHNTSHQKRYGQYFSGNKVAELLSALLPSSRLYSSAIDPMVGVGDLLLPAIQKVQPNSNVVGVEIDAPIAEQCAQRLSSARIINFCFFGPNKYCKVRKMDSTRGTKRRYLK